MLCDVGTDHGKLPVAALLSRKETNATVTLCHTGTRDLAHFTRQADIVVVAAGRAGTLTGDMLKPGATVIDVGVNRVPDATPRARGATASWATRTSTAAPPSPAPSRPSRAESAQ